MFKRLNKRGSTSLGLILSLPVLLLLLFLMVDFFRLSNHKVNLQRRLDSAVITIVNSAKPEGEVILDEAGIILVGDKVGTKACAITADDYDKGIDQLRRDVEYLDLFEINNISTNEQMENGIVRIQVKGHLRDMMINVFLPDIEILFVAESYSACVLDVISN